VSIGKSVPSLISNIHEFLQNFYQSLAICFELFSFGEFVYSKIADSGPHLSAAARRAGPARQLAAAAPDSRLLTRARPTVASPAPPASRPPRARRRCARQPPRSRRHPDRRGPKPPTPGPSPSRAARPSPSRRAAVSTPVSRRFPVVSRALVPSRHRFAEQRRRVVPVRARAVRRALRGSAELGRKRRAREPCPAWLRATPRTVHLGQERFRPSSTGLKFYYFLIYSIHCKFKILCRIHLNLENYETNFVGKV
jgi:hypothetical protein